MSYLEVVFDITNYSKVNREILIAKLYSFGFDSFEEKEYKLSAFIPNEIFDLETFEEEFPLDVIEKNQMKNENWNQIWESSFEPVIVSHNCRIRAPFHKKEKKYTFDFIIHPKMSFGTGHHATTMLMLRQLLLLDINNKKVLDVGSGTGVLAIAAEKKRAGLIHAIDIDNHAFVNSLENIKLNGCRKTSVFQANISEFKSSEMYDVIFANINKNVLLEEIKKYVMCLCSGGLLILSGFFESDFSEIHACASTSKLNLMRKKSLKNWLCLSYIK